MQNLNTKGAEKHQQQPDVGMKLAHERLTHREKGVLKPLCLACGAPATNDQPTCNEKKCVKTVRPVRRWAQRVASLAASATDRFRASGGKTRPERGDEIRFRINSQGAQVFNAGSWLPADGRILGNLAAKLREGLPEAA